MIVDAHVHVTGKVYEAEQPRGVTDLLTAMDRAGIDVSLVMSLSLEDNASVLAAGRAHCDRLKSFVVPVIGPETEGQVAQAASAQQVAGLGEFYVRCGSAQLPDVYLKPVLAAARTQGLPVMLHTGDFSYTAPALMERMVRQNPEVTFILAHMGSLSFVSDAIEVARRYRNVYLETSGMPSAAMLRRAVAECGPQRLLFGSDYPFWNPELEKARIESAGLNPGVERMVLGENAVQLFRL
ncbi:MAG: amidohydrolase family protein [Anaerolineae bacterium]|nr:amidohydrolase family protein [Anaerolineae bacterium]